MDMVVIMMVMDMDTTLMLCREFFSCKELGNKMVQITVHVVFLFEFK